MAEYIKRELALEKCDKLIDNITSCPHPEAIEGVKIVRNLILTDCETGCPTADVVEVVRCKDCGISRETEDEQFLFCMQFADTVDREAFCSYGVRREQ